MRRQLGLTLITTSLFLSTTLYAGSMELVYDGKVHNYDLPPISLYINNEQIITTVMPPVQIDNRVLVPAREVFEPMGAVVDWDATEKKVYVLYQGRQMILEVNSTKVILDGEVVELDVPAKIINDKVMVPIRFISEKMGFEVNWKSSEYAVYINEIGTTPSNPIVPETPTNPENGGTITPEVEEEVKEAYVAHNKVSYNGYYSAGTNIHQLSTSTKSYDRTYINTADVSMGSSGTKAIISASSPISSVKTSVQEGKIIVDIGNSISKLSSTISPSSNDFVKQIRTSQFTSDTTRVVFDLKAGALVNVRLNSDRTSVIIDLEKQYIEEMKVGVSGTSDTIFFKNMSSSQIGIVEGDQTLTFTINEVYLEDVLSWSALNTNHITNLTVKQVGDSILGKATFNKAVTYSTKTTINGTTLYIEAFKESPVQYSNTSAPTILLNKESGVNKSALSITDAYRERKLIIDLGSDYSSYFNTETIAINDGKVKTIEVSNVGTTKLTINTTSVYAVNLYETGKGVEIELVKPYEKYSQIVVVDAGHGGSDPGAVANGLKEKDLNFKHAMAVYKYLENDPNIKVYMTREEDVYPSLQFRTELANDIGAHLFVSMHNNSASASAVGSETLYYPSEISKQMAQLVQNNIIAYCGTTDRKIKSRADLHVLRESNMPAILVEAGFITNTSEAALINSSAFADNLGRAVYDGIVETFKLLN